MRTICFYTYEFFPFTSGGCGTYLRQVVDLMSRNNNIIILIHTSTEVFNQVDELYKNNKKIKVFRVQDQISTPKVFLNEYALRSYEFFTAFKEISKSTKIDTVEMFEYVGIGYYTLKNRNELPNNIKYNVRAHGSMKIIDYYEKDYKYDLFRKIMYQMEKFCLINADVRLFPLEAIQNDYSKFYKYDFSKLNNKISSPPLDYIDKMKKIKKNINPKNFLFFSNLKRIKSPETYVKAAVLFLDNNSSFDGKFIIAGADSQYNKKITYWQYLQNLIPKKYTKYFEYKGKITHDQLNKILPNTKAAVICSKWESFSLVFYELKKLGTDIIVRDISCFKKFKEINKFITEHELYKILNLIFRSTNTKQRLLLL